MPRTKEWFQLNEIYIEKASERLALLALRGWAVAGVIFSAKMLSSVARTNPEAIPWAVALGMRNMVLDVLGEGHLRAQFPHGKLGRKIIEPVERGISAWIESTLSTNGPNQDEGEAGREIR